MSMAATITGISLEAGDKLIALCDGEVCGEANCGEEVIYISISGSKKAPVSFAIERGDEWVAATQELLMYESNAVSGSPKEPTEIHFVSNLEDMKDRQGWYTLQGVKLDAKPTQRGVYIHNGRKEIIGR